jgi:hypothetical protein
MAYWIVNEKITLKSHKSVIHWYHEKEAERLGLVPRPFCMASGIANAGGWVFGEFKMMKRW